MFMGFGLIFTVLIVAAIAYGIGWRPQGQGTPFSLSDNGKTPLDIAKERYASGELNKDEFEQVRHNLTN